MTIIDIVQALGLAALATVNVGLWTLRVALAARGRRLLAVVIAGVEALLFAMVFGAVVGSLDEPLRVVAYAMGVALGTLIGIIADTRLSGGTSHVQVVVDGDGLEHQHRLHRQGWAVTATGGTGVRGSITVLSVAVDDAVLPQLLADIDRRMPDGFVTVDRLHEVRPISLPGMHAPGGRHATAWRRGPGRPPGRPVRLPRPGSGRSRRPTAR